MQRLRFIKGLQAKGVFMAACDVFAEHIHVDILVLDSLDLLGQSVTIAPSNPDDLAEYEVILPTFPRINTHYQIDLKRVPPP